MYFQCIFNVFSMYFQCICNVFSMYLQCIFNVFHLNMYLQCYLGCNATLEIFTEELKELWSPGILIGNVIYRIGLVNGIWDGKGFEQVTKTQGTGSLRGCNACDFPGITFAGTRVYPFYSRYIHADDPRRLKRPPRGVQNY